MIRKQAPFSSILLLVSILASGLSGCSLLPEQIDVTEDWSANRFYFEAHEAMTSGGYEKAIEYFEKLQARFPYDKHAMQAQIETIYAYYKWDESASAIAAADRFIKQHPRHPSVDYVYYMRGLVNYDEGRTMLSDIALTDPATRDPKAMREAFHYFSKLVTRFPQSKYSEDARKRMLFTRNKLAEHELHVAKFYMDREAYVAASKRANYVIENFQKTPVVRDALLLLVDIYHKMGMEDLAADTERVYAANYPE
ncbi:MAG: outer membrane protein assembly factor BamD [Gammaproteobacteria bacterium]|uniref:Outer membrane protein assembly factor BamD n=1 Tax=Candidatus Thiopontia autotrophica TaxID=2841688 RepID=A0A8J6TPU7_9GAMM|nr:outer membrane protein assembly factor BamD [Candidatus Thiopontia autotrophica]